jgi:aerobic-type carbon monoxide dehydrogenase small subunit (CoxS/CutS family)
VGGGLTPPARVRSVSRINPAARWWPFSCDVRLDRSEAVPSADRRRSAGPTEGGDSLPTATAARLATTLEVNGDAYPLLLEPRRTLLDALRGDLGLTGTKKVCEMGDCGACTVIVDGRAMYACLLLAVDCAGRQVVTIEGLAAGQELDPIQGAFVELDAFQCGFCTPGQVMSLRALLDAHPDPSDAQIERAVTGNLCRCGAYRNIVAAGRRAVEIEAERRAAASVGGVR